MVEQKDMKLETVLEDNRNSRLLSKPKTWIAKLEEALIENNTLCDFQ